MAQRCGIRIGELLVEAGVLSHDQVEQVLEAQRREARPFGDLAERMFGIEPEAVEQAWVDQYLSFDTEIDLETQRIDTEVLRLLNRRQAWQFRLLPLRRESGELLMTTTARRLVRAANFSWRRFNDPVMLLISRRGQLEQFLQEHYPWPAMEDVVAAEAAAGAA